MAASIAACPTATLVDAAISPSPDGSLPMPGRLLCGRRSEIAPELTGHGPFAPGMTVSLVARLAMPV
jgi:hypothetical protein